MIVGHQNHFPIDVVCMVLEMFEATVSSEITNRAAEKAGLLMTLRVVGQMKSVR